MTLRKLRCDEDILEILASTRGRDVVEMNVEHQVDEPTGAVEEATREMPLQGGNEVELVDSAATVKEVVASKSKIKIKRVAVKRVGGRRCQ